MPQKKQPPTSKSKNNRQGDNDPSAGSDSGSGSGDNGTARPAVKRIRSDRDHSKAENKAREERRGCNGADGEDEGEGERESKGKSNEEGGGEGKGEDEHEDEDEDWRAQAPFRVGESWNGWETIWRQSCWCGKVAFAYNADPLQAKYCHCEDCQRLHGAPFQHAAVFKKDTARLDSDAEWLGFLSAHGEVHPLSHTPTPLPRKISCRACGSNLMDEGRNMLMAFPPTFEWPRTHAEVRSGSGSGSGSGSDTNDSAHNDKDQATLSGNGRGQKRKPDAEADADANDNGTTAPSHSAGGSGHKHPRTREWTRKGLPDVFRAKCHIFYERRVVDVRDGLIKWRGHKEKSDEMGEDED